MSVKKIVPFLFTLLGLLGLTYFAIAQDTCPEIVSSAIDIASERCSNLLPNYACYGNPTINATPSNTALNFQFDVPGDQVVVTDIDEMQLSSQSEDNSDWGIAHLKIPVAGSPQETPSVNLIVFGDVYMNNESDNLADVGIEFTINGDNINVRRGPSRNDDIVGRLSRGDTIIAIARDSSSEWVGFKQGEDEGLVWVNAELLAGGDDLSGLALVSTMQAFTFQSGTDSACEDVLQNGIIIQTPSGTEQIRFIINGAQVDIGSTVFLRTDGTYMYLTVLDGHASITTADTTVNLPAGITARVRLNPLERPEVIPYDGEQMRRLIDMLTDDEAGVPLLENINIAEPYELPIITYVSPLSVVVNTPKQSVSIDFYNADGDDISHVYSTYIHLTAGAPGPEFSDRLEYDFDLVRNNQQGTLNISIGCLIKEGDGELNEPSIITYDIEIEDTHGLSEPYRWSYTCLPD